MLTPEQIACFKTFGFLFFRQAFSTEEMESLIQAAEDVWTQELGRPPEVEEDVHTVPFVEKHPRLMSLVDDDRDGLLPARTQTTEFPDARGHYGEMIVMLHHMADCVLKGETPWVGVREGARIVSTGLACWESLRTGKPITVRNEF